MAKRRMKSEFLGAIAMYLDTFDDSGWFTLDTLPSPLHSQFHSLLEKHKSRLSEIIK